MATEWGTARCTRALSHACVGAYYHDPRKGGRERGGERARWEIPAVPTCTHTGVHVLLANRAEHRRSRHPTLVGLVLSRSYSISRLSHDRINIATFLLLSIYRVYTYVYIMNSSVTLIVERVLTSRDSNRPIVVTYPSYDVRDPVRHCHG